MFKYIRNSPHRNFLEEKLISIAPKIKGKVLDIGSKNRRYDYLFDADITAGDIIENPKMNIIKADINNLPFKDKSFNAVLCIEVLEHIKTPKKAVEEMYRVLKNKGILVVSLPLTYKIHDDYLRYTKSYIEEEFMGEFKSYKISQLGNFYSIILDILRDKIMFIQNKGVRFILYIPYLTLTMFIPLVSKLTKDKKHLSGYFIEAKKC